jgi:hypothetical protein
VCSWGEALEFDFGQIFERRLDRDDEKALGNS